MSTLSFLYIVPAVIRLVQETIHPPPIQETKTFFTMQLSLSRYRCMLFVQNAFLLADLVINTFCEYLRFESVILLVVFV
jgi:hypothetical protein